MREQRCVSLLSGGIDSSTLLFYLLDRGYEVHALAFLYGQRHWKEVEVAKRIAEYAGVEHKVVDISAIRELIAAGALTGDEPVPKTFYTEEMQRVTVVPNRNMILLSVAVGYAVKIKASGSSTRPTKAITAYIQTVGKSSSRLSMLQFT